MVPEVSRITGLATSTLYNLRAKGEGPPFWLIRNRLRCYRSDLETWMKSAGKLAP